MDGGDVRVFRLENGERIALILSEENGSPVFLPTLFVTTQLRARNQATTTMLQALQSVRLLLNTLDRLEVDLVQRMAHGEFLALHEIDAILDATRFALSPAEARPHKQAAAGRPRDKRLAEVSGRTASIRAHYIRAYLKWLVEMQLGRPKLEADQLAILKDSTSLALDALAGRSAAPLRRAVVGLRLGLTDEQLAELIDIVDPTSARNPWQHGFVRIRNWLAVMLLLKLGVRRGELLGLKVCDFDARQNLVLVARRADDIEDPRREQPNAKTRDRHVPIQESLLRSTLDYVRHSRSEVRGVRQHGFLLVAAKTGLPLTLSALNKVFEEIRAVSTLLPTNFSPHVLRHTWNDHFSKRIDANGIDEVIERRTRTALMGWSDHSSMPAVYTRRIVQKKATAVILDMQQGLNVRWPNAKATDSRTARGKSTSKAK
jgi:integrase